MSYSDKGEDAEVLVDTLTIDGTTLSESNLAGLSSSDFQTLTQLSQELTLSTDMEGEDQLIEEEVEHEEEVVQTEIGAEEIEIETEMEAETVTAVDEILPDVKKTVPPLRPLTIAPKPPKMPMTMKPIGGGQQLLFLQGGSSGQAIKLVSPQGQELSLANISLGRPVTLKPAIKTITSQGNISLMQQKPVVMKKILAPGQKIQKPLTTIQNKQGQQFMVVQKSDQNQQVKLIQGATMQAMPSPTKTITLQQAQEMGLLTTGPTPKHTVLVNKTHNPSKTIKIVPQNTQMTKTISLNQLKSPTKILPATSVNTSKGQQRIIFKTAGGGQSVLPPGQIIQLTGNQGINSGQLHQINIPGKGMQYIKFVSTSTPEATTTINQVKTTPATANHVVLSEFKPIIAPKTIKTATVGTTFPVLSKVAIPHSRHTTSQTAASASKPATSHTESVPHSLTNADGNLESNGLIRPRKPCNCTKSQCLKLYCDCFANGEFCYMCNCMNCYNNLEFEDHRQRAIKSCLERNPQAFRPKIGKSKDMSGENAIRKHTKGCNCKRSGCLKNYCECYEAKIACSNNCKCVGCRNIEDSMEKKNIRITSIMDNCMSNTQPVGKMLPNKEVGHFRPRRSSTSGKQPINFITDDVIEATCQCLLTISDSAESTMQDEELTKKQIIEEFGRCLTEIIECSSSRNLN